MSRKERVEELIKEEISEILRKKVSDPRIGFVSITGVDLSPDFEQAKIFVSIFGEEKQKLKTFQGLTAATGYIRGELGKMLEMRALPKLEFVPDNSLERGSQVLNILSKIKHENAKTQKRPRRKNS